MTTTRRRPQVGWQAIRPPEAPPRTDAEPRWLPFAVAAVALALALGWAIRRGAPPAVLAAIAVGVLAAVAVGHRSARARHLIDRFAHAVGHLLTVVLFTIAGLFVVVVPHLLSRLFRTDPLGTTGRWDHPPPHRTTPTAAWSDDRPRPRATPDHRRAGRRQALRTAAIPLGILVIAGAVWLQHRRTPDAPEGFILATPPSGAAPEREATLREPAPAGLRDHPPGSPGTLAAVEAAWWHSSQWQRAAKWALSMDGPWRQENPYRFRDFRSKYITVEDGLRKSWRPPDCGGCKRLTVWMYGGSTTWGIDQRDDHTIASELARTAHDHGLTVDVQNRGITGFTQWHEAERFAYDLTIDPAPDLVIFYDGVNEIAHANGGNGIRGTHEAPVDAALFPLWKGTMRSDPPLPEHEGGRVLVDDYRPTTITRRAIDTIERYDRARSSSRATARAAGVPVAYFWQPSRYSRPLIDGEPNSPSWAEDDMRLTTQVASDHLAKDVIDLDDVLDDNRDPLFTDDVHHNELGARLIAEAIYGHLAPELERLQRQRD